VPEVFLWSADVDNSTGNIDYPGNVTVRGNVKGGFSIIAKGDIVVEELADNISLCPKYSFGHSMNSTFYNNLTTRLYQCMLLPRLLLLYHLFAIIEKPPFTLPLTVTFPG